MACPITKFKLCKTGHVAPYGLGCAATVTWCYPLGVAKVSKYITCFMNIVDFKALP